MQSPAATAEKLPDSLTFLPYLLSDGPLRRPEADLEWVTSQNGFVVEPPQRHSAMVSRSVGNRLSSGSTTTIGSFTKYGPLSRAVIVCLFGHSHAPCTLPPVTTVFDRCLP